MQIIPEDSTDRKYILLGFKIVGDFSFTIAIPVLFFVLIAQWFENKYGGSPYITIIAFVMAALITIKIIRKKAKDYGRQYEELNNLKKNKNN